MGDTRLLADRPEGMVDVLGATLLVVDDEPANLMLVERMLGLTGYRNIVTTSDPREVVRLYAEFHPDLILLDLNMPHLDGFQVMELLKAEHGNALAPILVLTAQQALDYRVRALQGGARDYLTKPFERAELLARVRNLLEAQLLHNMLLGQNAWLEERVLERTRALRQSHLEMVRRLGRAAEYRDNETGLHIIRMSKTSALLGKALGFPDEECELLLHASPMHDIGKIGISDQILLKPGKLEPHEWEIMKTHASIGAAILDGDDSPLLVMARQIALTHHERWDGSGYPNGLEAENIPMVGRIVAVADVFDALTSERPYKKAWTVEQALDYVREQSGRHFDPTVVEHFHKVLPEVLDIHQRYAEPACA